MMRKFIFVGSSVFLTAGLWGATITVLEKGTGKPIPRAEVTTGVTTCYTDAKGICAVTDTQGTTCTIRQGGYATQTVSFLNSESKSVYLIPTLDMDETVTVKGAPRVEVSQKRISIQEVKKIVPNEDPAQVPVFLPGVQKAFGFDSRWVVRGSGPADSVYYVDQVVLPLIFHPLGGLAGGLSILPDNLVEDVNFSNGGFGPQYGDATGGVLTLNTKREIPDWAISEARVNVPFFGSLYHARPVGEDQFVSASYRKSFLEYVVPPVLKKINKGKEDLTIVPYFGDGNFEYLKKREDGQYKVLFIYSYDGIKAAFPSAAAVDESGKSNVNSFIVETNLSVNRRKTFNANWSLNVTPNWLQYRQETDFFGNSVNLNANNINVPLEVTYRKDRNLKVFTGVDATWSRTVLDLLVPRPPLNDPFYDIETAPKLERVATMNTHKEAVWVGAEWRLGDWIVAPGIRGFQAEAIGRQGADPRFNLRWELSPKYALKGAVGQYSQLPAPDQTDEVFGNSQLKYIQCMHYVLGVETKWSEQWETDIQVFYKRFIQMVQADPILGYNNDGSGVSRGFEVFLRRTLTSRLFGWIAYTWSINRVKDADTSDTYPSPYDQTHIFHLVGDYRLSTDWSVGGRYLFQSGTTYTPVTSSVYNTNLDKYSPRYPITEKNSGRLPLTRSLSVFANRDILYDRWTFKLRFGMENYVLGQNVNRVAYNYDYSQTQPVKGLAFIPYVELRAVL
jgi:hypothetical protein